MPNEPLTAARLPAASAAPNVPQDLWNAIWDVADNTIPNFASTTARDTAYASWTAQGGVMRDGLHCWVGATRYVYLSGTWREDPVGYQTKAMRAQRTVAAPFPAGAWTAFTTNTNWSESDPWGMRSTGATVSAPWTGWYTLTATIHFNNNSTGYRGLRWNPSTGVDMGAGAGLPVYLGIINATTGGSDTIFGGSTPPALLTAGNTVTLEGYQNSGGDLDVTRVQIGATYLGPNT